MDIIAYHYEDEFTPRSLLLKQWAERWGATEERRHLVAAEAPQQFVSQDDMLDHMHSRQRIADKTPWTIMYRAPENAQARREMWRIYRIGDGHAKHISDLAAAGYAVPAETEAWSIQRRAELDAMLDDDE